MGYEIHIKRMGSNNNPPISLAEWKEFVKSDSSIAPSPEDPNLFIWKEHPEKEEGKKSIYLRYFEDRILATHPDEFLTLKMFDLAMKLNAKLSDDEGVLGLDYKEQLKQETQRILEKRKSKEVNKPWWKFW